ncbi:MAG TPA: HYR domain-containing protein, partial [Saprospiraceae bacterium]|nr:HYR domain-containing protein [Saprospiraceae bacterium]
NVTLTQTNGLPSGSAFPLGNTQVRFVATDVAGLTAECIFSVSVSDDDAPTITCPSTINVGTAAPNCSAVVNYSVTATDNCSGTTVTRVSGLASGSTYPLGTTNHVYRASDAVGNSSTCSFNVVVSDDDQPNITTCPPNIQLNTNANCEAQLGDYRSLVVANDNCSTPTISQSPAPGSIVPGFSTVTMIATDAAGNSRTCTFQTTAIDGTPPSISCASEQFINANPVTCAVAAPNFISLQNATDNCGNPIVTQSPAPGTMLPYGQSTLVFTATDGPGFTATCSMQVTVVDVTPPVLTCPPSVTLGTDDNTCTAVAMFICAVAPDNCSGSANPDQNVGLPSGSAFPRGVNVVGFQATDQAGNVGTCTFTITVVDDQAPDIFCPQPITRNTDPGLCTAVVTWTPVATADNCDVPTLTQTGGLANGSAFPKGTSTVSFRSTDSAGNSANCSFTVTVVDAELPVITCPANIVRSTDPNLCTAVVTYTVSATDNCPGVTTAQVSGLPSGAAFPKGVTTNVWRATDAAGNSSTCSFTVTVNDTQLPTITCPANIVRSNDLNQCGAVVTYTVTATDNCPGVTTTQTGGIASGGFFPVGTTTNTWKATDASGNMATCSFTVTVNDTQSPVLMCPGNITVNNSPNLCAGVASWAPIMATDNCPGVTVSFVSGMASGSLFPVGTTTIVYRATDASGNSVTCSWTVTVKDVQKPTVTCPASITKNNDWNKCSAAVPFLGTPIIADNCGIASTSNTAIGVYPVGVTVVTFSATDVNGNTNSCSLTVTVKDYQPPTITCPANISAYSEPAAYCGAKVNYTVTATDNCPGVTVVSGSWPEPEDGYYPIGTTMVMATATDAAGNTAGCMFNIVVIASPEICDGLDNDCDGFVDEDELLGQVASKTEAGGLAGDLYGSAVAVWGDYAVVGAKGDSQKGASAGIAYILKRNAGGTNKWGRIAKLQPVLVGAGDDFGSSVAINADWAIVGAPGDGKAYIFRKDEGGTDNWGFVKMLSGAADDNFGAAVAVSGDYALVGANMDDEKGLNAGAAYVFNKDQGGVGAWGQVAKLSGTDSQAGDLFGSTLDLEGDMAVVGAPLNDEKGLNAGAAYLFDRSNGWQQTKKLTAADAAALDNYGVSVSMSETTVAIGSSQDDDKGSSSGSVYMYEKSVGGAANWGQLSKLTALDGTANDQFGYALALSGRYMAAGARFDDPRGFKSGSMYVFYRQDDGAWVQLTKFFDAGGDSRDFFGSSIGLHKGTIAAGAPGNDFGNLADEGSVAFFSAGCEGNLEGQELEVRDNTSLPAEMSVRTFPQPFSNMLNIAVEVPTATEVRISVWNSLGQEISVVHAGSIEGATTFQWDAAGNAAGAYYVRVQTGDRTEVKPVLLAR